MIDAQFWWECQLVAFGFAAGIVFTIVIFMTGDAIGKRIAARRAPDPYEIEFKDRAL